MENLITAKSTESLSEPSTEEADNLQRSTKKYKGGDAIFSHDQSMVPTEEKWMEERMSFKEMLMCHNGEWELTEVEEEELLVEEDEGLADEQVDPDEATKNPNVFRETDGDGRVNFKLSDAFKKRAWRPWRKAIYVKLLGKRIALPIMKKRLENMWARGTNLCN